MDDIIFASTYAETREKFELTMKSKFKMSMMGELTFFLGLQVKHLARGTFINQSKYVLDLLNKFDMKDTLAARTRMSSTTQLNADLSGKSVDQKNYRGIIGSLHYLTASRPDIMYSTCVCVHVSSVIQKNHTLLLSKESLGT